MMSFIMQHQVVVGAVALWVLSAVVSAMPEPMPNGGQGYLFLYKFVHSIAGNVFYAFGNKLPALTKQNGN